MPTTETGTVREKSHGKLCLVALFLCWVTTAVVWAQMPTATVLGVVKDATGAVVPSASLTARNLETGQTRRAVAGTDGSYRLSALPVGIYEIRAEQPGFRAALHTGLTLTVAQEAVVNFTLEVGAIEQTVTVAAEAPMVDTTSGSLGGLVDEQRVSDLPLNGRNYINLTLMQTGVNLHSRHGETAGSTGTWFSSNGATTRSNNYLLDGASMMTTWGASSASIGHSTLGVEGIREYRVITNSFSAEYGMTMGSQMVIASKNGTNTFHGSLFEYLRNSALDARNFFDLQTVANKRRLPPFTRNQFGGSVGGPIRRDKLFFYGVYEALRERLGVTTVSDTIPPAARADVSQISPIIRPLVTLWPEPNLPNNKYTFPFSQPTTENYGQIRVDQTVSASDSLFGRLTIDDAEKINPREWPQWRDPRTSRFQFTTLSETRIVSPTLLNTARFSFSRTWLKTDSISGVSGPQFAFIPGQEVANIVVAGVTRFQGDNASPSHNKQNIYTWSDDLFYTRGRHSLKFGTLINRFQQYTQLSLQSKGNVTFANIATFLQGRVQNLQMVTAGSRQERYYESTSAGFYVQDDLRLASRLNLNLGLRYEFLTIPQEAMNPSIGSNLRDIQHDAQTTLGRPLFGKNPSLRNFSPRFGFAWDVRGDGRTAIRGGFGLLYDINSPYGSAMLSLAAATPPFSSLSSLQDFNLTALPVVLPPEVIGKSLRIMDYALQQSHILQYNLTVQRQLPFDMALTLAYAGSRGLNLMQHRDGNPTTPQILPDGRKFWTGNEPRINPNWTYIRLNTAGGNSWYNSFQFGLQKRLSKGLQFQSSYTWSKVIDETQGVVPNDSSGDIDRVDPTDRKVDRGLAGFDILHNWRFNTIYRLPEFSSGGSVGKVLNGWWMSGILSLQGGYPFSVGLQRNRSRSKANDSGSDRPDLRPGIKAADIIRGVSRGCGNFPAGTPVGTWERWYDPCAFAVQPAGFLGTAGRGIIRGPGLANVDFSIGKDTALGFLGESGKLEFRAEFFNLLNRVNLGTLGGTSAPAPVFAGIQDVENPLGNAGRITSTGTTSRQIQLALRLLF